MENMENQNNSQNNYLLPASIVIAAALIAGAWIYTSGTKNIGNSINKNQPNQPVAANIDSVKPVSADDHILGDPNAPVKIIEFSDLECPFCKRFQGVMKQVMDQYGKDGKVAWIYRHYPLTEIHPKTIYSAQASECAAELGGNDKFWVYIDKYFEITPSNNMIDLNQLPQIAQDIGLDKNKFQDCLNSGKYSQKIKDQAQDAQNSGAQGTPYSIVISKSGKKYVVNGAYSFDDLKTIIDQALNS